MQRQVAGELRVEELGSSWRPWDVPKSRAPNSSAAKKTPTAVFRPSSATAIPRKPTCETGMSRRRDAELPAEHVDRAGEAGERARDRHRQEVVLLDVDAAVARRLGVEADRAHLEAERRAVEDDPEDDERADRDEEADVEPLQVRVAPEDRQVRVLRRCRSRSGEAFGAGLNGPWGRRSTCPIQIAIQLSMIVEITSWAPVVAFRNPAIPAQSAPATSRRRRQRRMCGTGGMPGPGRADRSRRYEPTKYWPWPPMLNIPQRNANATASPRRISGVVCEQRLLEVRGRRCRAVAGSRGRAS